MRILIVGAGIAGLTLAALLQRRGIAATLIERMPGFDRDLGYMLGLYPIGSRVLHGLGLYDRFLERSEPLRWYQAAGSDGRLIRRYPMDFLDARYGPIGQATRPALIDLLRTAVNPSSLRMGTSVVRAPRRSGGRVVLVGDAAVAFLPTAGIGASMAMESAATLDDQPSRTNPRHLPSPIALYGRRRRARLEQDQDGSRCLARLMFVRSRPLASARHFLMRFVTSR